MKNLIVFDIDGCILDPTDRFKHFSEGKVEDYHAAWEMDTIIPQGIAVYSLLMNTFHNWVFITGRTEYARPYTLTQLSKVLGINVPSEKLLMRPTHIPSSVEHDAQLKPRLLQEAGYKLEDVFLVFEDRQKVVDEWRRLGCTVYQTAPGDF